jgi:hypothetical protein
MMLFQMNNIVILKDVRTSDVTNEKEKKTNDFKNCLLGCTAV